MRPGAWYLLALTSATATPWAIAAFSTLERPWRPAGIVSSLLVGAVATIASLCAAENAEVKR